MIYSDNFFYILDYINFDISINFTLNSIILIMMIYIFKLYIKLN